MLIPLIIGAIINIVAKVKQEKKWRVYSYQVFKEWEFSALLFVEMHLTISICLSLMYDDMKAAGVVFGGLLQIAILVYLVLLVKKGKNFGEYKSFFHQGAIKSNWYIVVLIFRTLIGLLIGYFWSKEFCSYAVLSLAGVWMILGVIVRPYVSNVRPIVNTVFVFTILGLFMYADVNKDSNNVTFMTSYLPLWIIGVLILALIFNLVCLIVFKCQSCKKDDKDELNNSTLSRY